jgi:TolB protein
MVSSATRFASPLLSLILFASAAKRWASERVKSAMACVLAAWAPETALEPTATQVPPATVVSSATAAAIESPTGPPNPFAGSKAWIAYQTNKNGGEGIWLMHPDGTEDHLITKDFQGHWQLPDWSPDGKKIVVTPRDTGGTEPLYEYDLETETYRQLFPCEDPCLGDDEPAYSPDGTKVAFIRALGPFVHSDVVNDDVPSDCGLWIGEVATDKVAQVTSNTNPPCDREVAPRWSPDSSKIAYFRERIDASGLTDAIFVMDANGGNEKKLTDWQLVAGYPNWSPDGEWIVFATHPLYSFNFDHVVSNLYRMHPDGSGMEQLTFNETPDLRANHTIHRMENGSSSRLYSHRAAPMRGNQIEASGLSQRRAVNLS